VLGCAKHLSPLLLHAAEATLIHPSAWKVNSANFAFTEFSEVRQRFISDSLPVASVSALCNTAAGLRVTSHLYARRREEGGDDQPSGGAGSSGG
jgi:hypothetical protein